MISREPTVAALSKIFADVFMRDDIALSDGLTAKDVPGWDSFKHVEILMATEDRFAMKFSSAEIDNIGRLGDLVDIVMRKGRLPRD